MDYKCTSMLHGYSLRNEILLRLAILNSKKIYHPIFSFYCLLDNLHPLNQANVYIFSQLHIFLYYHQVGVFMKKIQISLWCDHVCVIEVACKNCPVDWYI